MAEATKTGTGFTPSKVNLEDFVEKANTVSAVKNIPFDTFFQILKSKNANIKPHHREPIRIYIQKAIPSLSATEEEFNEAFKNY